MRKRYMVISKDKTGHQEVASFEDYDKAKNYLEELQNNNTTVSRCWECRGSNKDCPYYIEPFFDSDSCESSDTDPFGDVTTYCIEEIEE